MGSYTGSARDSLISVISPRASLRLSEKIWVGGTITLISFLVYVPQVFIIWPWYGRELGVSLLKLLIPFNSLAIMMFRCYYLCVNTSPGSVPAGWTPPTDPDTPLELKSKTSQHRFCKTCRIHKPPRTHHCRRCGKCVLKMDHHCPWVANCVGFYNQGHFIRFLIYVDLATTYHLCMMGMRMKSLTAWTSPEPSTAELILVIVNFALCVPVWLMVGVFSIYHMYCAAGNSTTIEGWEKDRVATMVRRGKIREVKYPYNLGFYANICSVLGRNPLLWLWPQRMKGDGLSYPVSQVIGASDQFTWPPQDPSRYPARVLPYSSGSAFTYGNGSFNPNLQPSSSRLRARTSSSNQDEEQEGGNSTGPLPASLSGRPPAEDYSSGEERDREDKHWTTDSDEDRSRENSSPEPYLSDFDDDSEDNGTGDRDAERGMARTRRVRVRRGSEGYEIAPRRDWGAELMNDDMHMDGDGFEMTRMGDDNDHDDDNADRKKL